MRIDAFGHFIQINNFRYKSMSQPFQETACQNNGTYFPLKSKESIFQTAKETNRQIKE